MDTIQAIEQRRAIKHYDNNFIIPSEEVNRLLELALQSPTSFNIQNWRILQVNNPQMRKQIKQAAWEQEQVIDASLLFVMCADLKSWEAQPERYWQNAPQDIQELMISMIKPFYEGKEQLQRDEAMRSIGIAAQTMMLAAKSMGYDSCPMIGFDSEQVAKIINLPENYVIGMLLVVGKATKAAWPKPGQLPLDEILTTDSF